MTALLAKSKLFHDEKHEETVWDELQSNCQHIKLKARNYLLTRYYSLVVLEANDLYSRYKNNLIEKDDLKSMGIFGLIKAIERYNSKMFVHNKFDIFARKHIRGAIIDRIRTEVSKRTQSDISKRVQQFTEQIMVEKHRNPTTTELEEHVKKYDKLVHVKSLDQMETHKDGKRSCYFISDDKNQVEKIHNSLLFDGLNNGLSRDEKLIIALKYIRDMTLKEIGAVIGIGESRISQLHSELLLRLKEIFEISKIGFSDVIWDYK